MKKESARVSVLFFEDFWKSIDKCLYTDSKIFVYL